MNSSDRIAVQRYAAAYNGLSASNEEAARRAADLRAAQEALSAVREYMTSPRVSSEQKTNRQRRAARRAGNGVVRGTVD